MGAHGGEIRSAGLIRAGRLIAVISASRLIGLLRASSSFFELLRNRRTPPPESAALLGASVDGGDRGRQLGVHASIRGHLLRGVLRRLEGSPSTATYRTARPRVRRPRSGRDLHRKRHVLSGKTFRPFLQFEEHILSLSKSAETVPFDVGIMNEHVRPVGQADEAVPLGVVEPLHDAVLHGVPPYSSRMPTRAAPRMMPVLPRGRSATLNLSPAESIPLRSLRFDHGASRIR